MLRPGQAPAVRPSFLALALAASLAAVEAADVGPDQASFSVSSDRAEYVMGENVILRFNLRNDGTGPISLAEGGDYRGSTRARRFSVDAVGPSGRKAADPAPDDATRGGFIRTFSIQPGETHAESFSLTRYCRIEEPGVYHIRVHREGAWSERRFPFPAREIVLSFRMPSPAEAEAILDDLETVRSAPGLPGGRSGPKDYSSLQVPLYAGPLAARASRGDSWALTALANIARPEATEALIGLARGPDEKLALAAVQQLKRRMPWTWVMTGPLTHDQLVSAAWERRFEPDVRTLAVGWIASDDRSLVAAGADLLRSVAGRDDDRLLFGALTRLLPSARTAGPNYPPPIAEILGAVHGLQLRGYAFDERSLDRPGAVFAYLDSLRARPGPRPPGWRRIFDQNYQSPFALIREAAIYSLPYPVPPDCSAEVDSLRADPDEGIKSALLFATERKAFVRSRGPEVPPVAVPSPAAAPAPR